MDILIQLALNLVLIAINALFAAAEIALVSVNKARLQSRIEEQDTPRLAKQIQTVLQLTEDSTSFLATIQIGITLVGFLASATAAINLSLPLSQFLEPFVGDWAENMALTIVTLLLLMAQVVLGELVPKQLALIHAEGIALSVAGLIKGLSTLSRPMVSFLKQSTNSILRLTGNNPDNRQALITVEELKAQVDAAAAGGTVDARERRMIRRIVELSELTARAVMVPRVNIQYLKVHLPLSEACGIAAASAHTRLPVCQDSIDHVIGILHVKDLVRAQLVSESTPSPVTLAELIRPVRHIPSSKSAGDLLEEMQEEGIHMVVVTDEFGGTAGLITLEDLLEEIVGEIRDEYDAAEEKEFEWISDTEAIFNIRASLSTVNNEMNLELPRGEAATLAGLFLEANSRQPQGGDRLTIEHVHLTVLEDQQRVRVQVVLLDPTTTL
ncbi:MAG: hemolysin family protein [Cyanobacteriota bacterium]|nr:hemolysin family protein [Cyanobacteriota bacterium]